jgi:hypothetical protein
VNRFVPFDRRKPKRNSSQSSNRTGATCD